MAPLDVGDLISQKQASHRRKSLGRVSHVDFDFISILEWDGRRRIFPETDGAQSDRKLQMEMALRYCVI